jgi:hypothetical protein
METSKKTTGKTNEKSIDNHSIPRTPAFLDKMVDLVLAYHPSPKTKEAEKRARERKKIEKENRKRESSI